jgi:hypothetical protein
MWWSMFGSWVLWVGVLFDVATGEERPAAQSGGTSAGRTLGTSACVGPVPGSMGGEGYSAKGACAFISKRGVFGKEQERPMVGVKVADGPGSGHLT